MFSCFLLLLFSIDKEEDKGDRAVAFSRELKFQDERYADDETERVSGPRYARQGMRGIIKGEKKRGEAKEGRRETRENQTGERSCD